MHRGRAAVRLADDLGHPGPELPGGAQLGDGHELVVVGGEAETDLPQSSCGAEPGFTEPPQVGDRGGDTAGQLPRRAGSEVVERGTVDGDRPDTARAGHPSGKGQNVVDRGCRPAAERRGQRVGAQINGQRVPLTGIEARHQRQHGFGGGGVVGAGVKDHRRQFQVHTFEQPVQLCRRHTGSADPQHQRAHPVGQRRQHHRVALPRGLTGQRERLGDLPARVDVTQRVGPSDVRPFAGQRRLR